MKAVLAAALLTAGLALAVFLFSSEDGGSVAPPGLVTLGTLPVTPVTGSPSIQLQIGPGTLVLTALNTFSGIQITPTFLSSSQCFRK